jgi:hypothetical protein
MICEEGVTVASEIAQSSEGKERAVYRLNRCCDEVDGAGPDLLEEAAGIVADGVVPRIVLAGVMRSRIASIRMVASALPNTLWQSSWMARSISPLMAVADSFTAAPTSVDCSGRNAAVICVMETESAHDPKLPLKYAPKQSTAHRIESHEASLSHPGNAVLAVVITRSMFARSEFSVSTSSKRATFVFRFFLPR